MNQVTNPRASAAAVVASLRGGLQNARAQMPSGASRDPFLKLMKDGTWAFGQNDTVVRNGTEAVINALNIQHGYCCWERNDDPKVKNQLLGEVLVPISQPKPAKSSLPDHGFDWQDMFALDVKFITGSVKGQQTLYKVNSVGGMDLVRGLIDAIMARLDDPEAGEFIMPVVELQSGGYRHAKWGRIATPEMPIISWMDLNGNEQGYDDDEPEPEPEPAPRSRRVAAPEPEPAPAPEPAPRSRRAAEPEPEPEPAPRSRRAAAPEPEPEPAPRSRRAAAPEPEPEPAPPADAEPFFRLFR